MKLFHRKKQEARSIDDILGQKESEKETFEIEEEKDENSTVRDTETLPCEPISPLDCFGMSEDRSETWLMKCVKVWYYVMSFFWFLFGAVTFAPVLFIRNKLMPVFKDKKISFLVALAIHALIIILFVIIICVRFNAKPTPVPISDF